MQEFKVNEFLSLRLESSKTNIYVSNELFRQCKFLLLDIPIEDIDTFDEIKSIDEVEMRSDRSLEFKDHSKIEIPPKTEFWAHCSNLQVWYENNQDTCLLHSELAFPLLKRLKEVGDPLAIKRFKEEIAKRFESGYLPTIFFLLEDGYDEYLTREELFLSLLGQDEKAEKEVKTILELEELIKDRFHVEDYLSGEFNGIRIMNHRIVELSIAYNDIEFLPESIDNLKYLKEILINHNNLKKLPDSFKNFKFLEFVCITNSKLKGIPEAITKIKSLKRLILTDNMIVSIPDSIKNLKSLKHLNLGGNEIKIIPKSISEVTSIEEILLEDNKIESLSETIKNLKSLRFLELRGNNSLKLDKNLIEALIKNGINVAI